jgi:signal transduction histidine kinase
MGGTYGVESTPGEGSRFWLELRGAEVGQGAVAGRAAS